MLLRLLTCYLCVPLVLVSMACPFPFSKHRRSRPHLLRSYSKLAFFFNTNCMFKPSCAFLMVLTLLVSKFIFTTYLQSEARRMSLILSSLLKSVSRFLHNYWRCTSKKGKKKSGPFYGCSVCASFKCYPRTKKVFGRVMFLIWGEVDSHHRNVIELSNKFKPRNLDCQLEKDVSLNPDFGYVVLPLPYLQLLVPYILIHSLSQW